MNSVRHPTYMQQLRRTIFKCSEISRYTNQLFSCFGNRCKTQYLTKRRFMQIYLIIYSAKSRSLGMNWS